MQKEKRKGEKEEIGKETGEGRKCKENKKNK